MTIRSFQPVLVPFDAQSKKVSVKNRTNLHTYRVRLGVRSRPSKGYTRAKLHEHTATPPTKAEVWLQLWEVDTWKKRAWREHATMGRRDQDLPPKGPAGENEELIEIGGYIRKPKKGRRPEFVALKKPTGIKASRMERYSGWLEVELSYVEAGVVKTGTVNVPIEGESETRLEIGSLLAATKGARQVGGKDVKKEWPRALPLIHLWNMQRVLQTQADDGGIALAFVVEYNSPLDKQAMRWRWGNTGPRPAKYVGVRSQTKLVAENEFVNAGKAWSEHYAGLTLGRGKDLTVGYSGITHHNQIAGKLIDVIRAARKAQDDKTLKIKRLAFFCHGLPTYLKTHGHGQAKTGDLTRSRLKTLLPKIQPYLAEDVIVPLFACDTGMTRLGRGSKKKEWDFGKDTPTLNVHVRTKGKKTRVTKGMGSFAMALAEGLAKHGKKSGLVWAHINAKHTTRNPYLRYFQVRGTSVEVKDLVEHPPKLTFRQLQRAAWERKRGRAIEYGAHFIHTCVCPLTGSAAPVDEAPGGPFSLSAALKTIKTKF